MSYRQDTNFQHSTANHALVTCPKLGEKHPILSYDFTFKNPQCCSKLLAVAYKRPVLALRSKDTEDATGTGKKKNGKFEVFIEMNIHSEVF